MLFPKLDLPAWRGAVPVLRYMDISEKVGRSKWYGLLTMIPIVNLFITTGLAVALLRSFDRFSFRDAAEGVLFAPIPYYSLAKNDKEQFVGPIIEREKAYQQEINEARKAGQKRKLLKLLEKNPYKKSVTREWTESIFFAVFAAAFIRMFFFEAYVIPTPSMEGSLLVGDYLFVSKMSYGIRTPQTVAMIPLLHNRVPGIGTESYLKKPRLPYFRLPALSNIDRNNSIVFNWPVGDSVYITPKRSYSVAQVKRRPAFMQSDPALKKLVNKKAYKVRPMDKKDHYVKRAVGVPGDTLEIKAGRIYIDGVPSPQPEHVQFLYEVIGDINSINPIKLKEWGIDNDDIAARGIWFLDQKQTELIKEAKPSIVLRRYNHPQEPMKLFPHDPKNFPSWSVDNYGPIWIPKAGTTVTLSPQNIALYKKLIKDYEGNELLINGNQYTINGVVTNEYTFKQDYYWAMGDNRHNSEDSRMWGFVPHDHMVGRPAVIWFSSKNGIRWDRIFKSVSKI